ncbi:hypothetical protein OY671_009948, partial [Metschnikowia pulcherrima]
AVAAKAFDSIADEALLAHVRAVGDRSATGLRAMIERYPDIVEEVRGKGSSVGVKSKPNNREMMAAAREQGSSVAGGGENCIRSSPPSIISEDEADEALAKLDATFAAWNARVPEVA